jgi:ABC-2 type transport system ATP-binding protein
MIAVDVKDINKSYDDRAVVSHLSFSVNPGEIFGLIGPNGAGKTTTIRMIMDIIKPDSGEIQVLGEKLGESLKSSLGYLPEERGLYRKQKVIDSIVYLASLKGMDRRSAEKRAVELLEQTGMLQAKNKKVEELSKGMSQIIQFIITIIHNPRLIVLDEPFASLDPVNTELLKGIVTGLRGEGRAIIMSTHQMNQVEELCDRVLMVNHGRAVLYGGITEIKARFRSRSVMLDYEGELPPIAGVAETYQRRGFTELVPGKNTTPEQVLQRLVASHVKIERFEVATPSLNDIFLQVVGQTHE